MDHELQIYEFSQALYLARQMDREAAQMIVDVAEDGLIGIEQATEALRLLAQNVGCKLVAKNKA